VGIVVGSNDTQARYSATLQDGLDDRLVTCRLDELRPHPSYVRHHLSVSTAKLSALSEQGELALRAPLAITLDRIILDGYARFELARIKSQPTLSCIEYDLSESEALHWLLQAHRRSEGLNSFCRILLALDLEPSLQANARLNQRVGGQNKGQSNLTEAERLDVRSEIAAAAGTSVGNVSKVKHLIVSADSELLQPLRRGEISIHRAWQWSKTSRENQREQLRRWQSERGIKKTIRTLISRHHQKDFPPAVDFFDLVRHLSTFEIGTLCPVEVAVMKIPGNVVVLTEELFQLLGLEQLNLCATNSR
jgi:hypothetical protein